MPSTVQVTLRGALDIAQRNESGDLDPRIARILEAELAKIWREIQAHPNSYTMTQLQFAVFNRYRARPEFQNEIARKAVERYWSSQSANNGVRRPIFCYWSDSTYELRYQVRSKGS